MEDKRQDNIERYIRKEMNAQEHSLFEKQLNEDKALKEDVLLQIALHDAFYDKSVTVTKNIDSIEEINEVTSVLKSDEMQKISSTIKNTIKREKQPKIRYIRYLTSGIAAAILIGVLLTFYFSQDSTTTLYEEYADWNNLPSLVEKGEAESLLNSVELLYRDNAYKKIIELTQDTSDPYVLIYRGVSFIKLNDFTKAEQSFDQLINSNSLESSRGYWYKSLLYLKQGKINKTKEHLEFIIKNDTYYNYKKALVLYEKIK